MPLSMVAAPGYSHRHLGLWGIKLYYLSFMAQKHRKLARLVGMLVDDPTRGEAEAVTDLARGEVFH